jgi:hypothetical protein
MRFIISFHNLESKNIKIAGKMFSSFVLIIIIQKNITKIIIERKWIEHVYKKMTRCNPWKQSLAKSKMLF